MTTSGSVNLLIGWVCSSKDIFWTCKTRTSKVVASSEHATVYALVFDSRSEIAFPAVGSNPFGERSHLVTWMPSSKEGGDAFGDTKSATPVNVSPIRHQCPPFTIVPGVPPHDLVTFSGYIHRLHCAESHCMVPNLRTQWSAKKTRNLSERFLMTSMFI